MADLRPLAVIDDDDSVREGALLVLEGAGRQVEGFASGQAFLERSHENWAAAFLDLKMPGLSGFDVLEQLGQSHAALPFPIIMVSAHGDIKAAVQAMKLGAAGFVEKPFSADALLDVLRDAECDRKAQNLPVEALHALTPREKDVAKLLNEGLTNKEVARQLECSPRTVEIHRARVLSKLGVRNVAGLIRLLNGVATG